MSNSNHTTYVTTYVTTYTYSYISIQIIKYKYINVTTFAHLSLHHTFPSCEDVGAADVASAADEGHVRRIQGLDAGISKNTKPMEFVYFMYNFESFFVFMFLCFESKENHFVLMQFHVFIWRISWFQFVKRFRQRKTKRLRPDEICTQLFIKKNHQKVHPFFISLSNVKHTCIHSYILTSFYTDSNAINAIDKN